MRIFSIVSRNSHVAGVVWEHNLTSFLQEALPNVKDVMIREVGTKFPVFCVENIHKVPNKVTRRGFIFWQDGTTARSMAEIDSDYCDGTTLYEFKDEWRGDPKKPGGDYMGALPHEHFGEDEDA